MAGPCIVCRDPDEGAVAATLTARQRGSHTAGCWSAVDWRRDRGGGRIDSGRRERRGWTVCGNHRNEVDDRWCSERRSYRLGDGEGGMGWAEEVEVQEEIDQSVVQIGTDERNSPQGGNV